MHVGTGRYYTQVRQSLGLPSSHGEEAGRHMAAMRGLQVPQQHHHPRQVSLAQHAGPGEQAGRLPCLQQT